MYSRTRRSSLSCSCTRSHRDSRDKTRSTETPRGTFHRGARPRAETTHAFRSRIGGKAAVPTPRASSNSERSPLESIPPPLQPKPSCAAVHESTVKAWIQMSPSDEDQSGKTSALGPGSFFLLLLERVRTYSHFHGTRRLFLGSLHAPC